MKAKDIFKISNKTVFSADDFKVLALLYQPLLGAEAYSIFLTIYHLSYQEEYRHQEIFDLLNMKNSDFVKAREKLEALGLLDVFMHEDNYIYVVKTPLTAKQFINDTILGSYLESEIGKKGLDKILLLFKAPQNSLDKYQNITKNFDDVFQVKELETVKTGINLRERTNNIGLNINIDFDVEELAAKISKRAKLNDLLNPKVSDELKRLMFVYQFSIDDIAAIYNDSLNEFGNVNCNTLKLNSRLYYQKNNLSDVPVITQAHIDNTVMLENVSPKVILQQYSKKEVTSFELEEINNLIARNGVSIGYINIVLAYVLKHKEGILPSLGYLEKVINSWQTKGIINTKLAIDYVTELSADHIKNTKSVSKNNHKEPDWFKGFLDDLDKGGW